MRRISHLATRNWGNATSTLAVGGTDCDTAAKSGRSDVGFVSVVMIDPSVADGRDDFKLDPESVSDSQSLI